MMQAERGKGTVRDIRLIVRLTEKSEMQRLQYVRHRHQQTGVRLSDWRSLRGRVKDR